MIKLFPEKRLLALILAILTLFFIFHSPFHDHPFGVTEENCPICQWQIIFTVIIVVLFFIFTCLLFSLKFLPENKKILYYSFYFSIFSGRAPPQLTSF